LLQQGVILLIHYAVDLNLSIDTIHDEIASTTKY
jgi:hypothetical protein